MKKILLTLTLGLLIVFTVNAQTNFELTQEDSKISVTGTSSLHDWEVDAEKFSGTAVITINEGELEAIDNLNLVLEVASLKSGKGLMDSKTRDAFKEKSNPEIRFELTGITSIDAGAVQAKGRLTMAGKTNEIQLAGDYEVDGSGNLIINGTKKLNMTDYDMKPPTAMMGTIKAGAEVEVIFSVVLKNNKELTNL